MSETNRPLPLWPLTAACALVPLWWALGLFQIGWPLLSALLVVVMLVRGRITLPPASRWWLLLLALVLLSATAIDRANGVLTFGLRMGFLLTAFVTFVYAYNVAREGDSWHRALRPLAYFWLAVVSLGWLGVLAPDFMLDTVAHRLLPDAIANTRFAQSLTVVRATEFRELSSTPIYRTAAPYPYTNNWGTGYVLLLPCALAYLAAARTGVLRIVLWVALPLSVVPAFRTLNRGMFLALGVGLIWLAGRALLRGRLRPMLSVAGVALLFGLFSFVIPVRDQITERVATTDTNVDRLDIYAQTWAAVLSSPLFGHGVPTSVDTTHAAEPLGTQGMLWNIMYSHGLPALVVFLVLLVAVARRLDRAVSPAGQWLAIVPVIALAVMPYYGYLDPNLTVVFYAAAVGLAAVTGAAHRAPDTAPASVQEEPVRAAT